MPDTPRAGRRIRTVLLPMVAIALLVVTGLLAYAATRPGIFHVQRSARVQASAERIAGLIRDFRRWQDWSPYEQIDPAMTRIYSGAPSGMGAIYAWDGKGKAGAGRMEIIDAASPARTVIRLDFLRPFEAHNTATFTIDPHAEGTDVTWSMDGPMPYIAKLMSIFIHMDQMIGKDFTSGLAKLKAVAEIGATGVARTPPASALPLAG